MNKMTWPIIFSILMIIVAPTVIAKPTNIYEKSFATPEKAITYFMKSLINNKVSNAFKVCAVNDYSEKYNFNAFSKRLDSISYLQSMAPAEYQLYVELNKIECLARIGKQIKLFYYSILSGENDLIEPKYTPSDGEIEKFIQAVDPKRLSVLEVISIDKPLLVDDERYKKNASASAQCFGANDATERVALLKFNNDFYIIGFYLIKYGSSWKISSLCSPLANTPMYGVKKITLNEYIY